MKTAYHIIDDIFPTGLRSWEKNCTNDVVRPNRQSDERVYSKETVAGLSVNNEKDDSQSSGFDDNGKTKGSRDSRSPSRTKTRDKKSEGKVTVLR